MTKRERHRQEVRLERFAAIADDPSAVVSCPSCPSGFLQVQQVFPAFSSHEELRIGCAACETFDYLLRPRR